MVHPKEKTPGNGDSELHAGGSPNKETLPSDQPVVNSQLSFQQLITDVEDYAILLLDKNGIITSWNKGAEQIKGYKAEEIIGKHFRTFYTPEDRKANLPEAILEETIANGRATHEGYRVRKNGSRFWGNVTLTAIKDASGSINGFLKLTRDLTERKIAEDQYSNYLEELKQSNENLRRSEERYNRMIAEVQDYAIILLDKEGKVLEWNKGAEKLKGYTTQEILGKSHRLFYTREDKDKTLPQQLLKAAAEHNSVINEGWRIRKDGSRFWASVTITSLHSSSGELIGYTKVTRDLTQSKMAEDRLSTLAETLQQKNELLQQSEARYHQMIAEVEDYSIIFLDKNGNVQNWNIGAVRIKGYTAEEVIGKNFQIFYTAEDLQHNVPQKLLQQAAAHGKVSHEGWRVRKDGSRFWGSVVITAIHDSNQHIIGFSKVTRDLTERKAAEDALKESAEQLDEKNRSLEKLNAELSSFAYVASHDMKEPLRKIQAFSSRLESLADMPEKSKDFIEKIRMSAQRMHNLIEDILSFSQISNGSNKKETCDLNEIVNTVKSDLELSISEKNATINVAELPVIQAIPFQLQQLFLNLISNALKFSKKDEAPLINITCRQADVAELPEGLNHTTAYHKISFADNGIGFEEEYARRIFGAFERLHSKDAFTGSGIGLAIVKKVMEAHHGEVIAEGKPEVGATFHLYFPIS